jgi:glycosyltransferase involved in cell wall biosynthesis
MVVWDLVCGLSKAGHKVRLFAPEGSLVPPGGELVTTGPALDTVDVDWMKSEEAAFDKYIINRLDGLDILHGHDWFGMEYKAKASNPSLKVCHTHHGHLDPNWWLRSKPPFKLNFIGISAWMKKNYDTMGMPSEFVYNGIEVEKYPFQVKKGERLLYVGRFDRFKQPHVAIGIARKLGMGLDLVGGTFVNDKAYLEQIKNACDGKQITFNPDVSQETKINFMKNAKCLLFPSAMGEPFGLVAAEAMCCGTPVIALNDGAIGEVVRHGVTGYVCKTADEMTSLVNDTDKILSQDCRELVEKNFSREKMAEKYVELYRRIINGQEF